MPAAKQTLAAASETAASNGSHGRRPLGLCLGGENGDDPVHWGTRSDGRGARQRRDRRSGTIQNTYSIMSIVETRENPDRNRSDRPPIIEFVIRFPASVDRPSLSSVKLRWPLVRALPPGSETAAGVCVDGGGVALAAASCVAMQTGCTPRIREHAVDYSLSVSICFCPLLCLSVSAIEHPMSSCAASLSLIGRFIWASNLLSASSEDGIDVGLCITVNVFPISHCVGFERRQHAASLDYSLQSGQDVSCT